MNKPFSLTFEGGRYIVGSDRFSETAGLSKGPRVVVAELRFPTQTDGVSDTADMHQLGRLLAAAPDMLEALEKAEDNLLACIRPGDALAGTLATIRAAIAKARGGA
jgi:hypothetical protein